MFGLLVRSISVLKVRDRRLSQCVRKLVFAIQVVDYFISLSRIQPTSTLVLASIDGDSVLKTEPIRMDLASSSAISNSNCDPALSSRSLECVHPPRRTTRARI